MTPDDEENVSEFYKGFENNTKHIIENSFDWDFSNFGYITWEQIHKLCENNNLVCTLENFNWNKGQIYKETKK